MSTTRPEVSNDESPREQHLAWCKARAHEELSAGRPRSAIMSMMSDLQKSEHTSGHPAIQLGAMLLASGKLATTDAVAEFIDGFR